MSDTDEFGHDAAYWKTREAFVRRRALENLVRDEEHRRASRRREADRRDRKERRRLTWQAIKRRLFP